MDNDMKSFAVNFLKTDIRSNGFISNNWIVKLENFK